jgi:hypothetical protein
MVDTATPMKSTAVPGSALADIAKQLNAEYTAVVAGGIVQKALEFGHRLKQTKAQVGYGLWGSWVKASCKFTERTAHRYINLAEKQNKLPLTDQTRMSELTLNEAFRLTGDKAARKSQDASKVCDRATKALLESLWKLDARTAEYKAKDVIGHLQELLSKRVPPLKQAS